MFANMYAVVVLSNPHKHPLAYAWAYAFSCVNGVDKARGESTAAEYADAYERAGGGPSADGGGYASIYPYASALAYTLDAGAPTERGARERWAAAYADRTARLC